MSQTQLLEKEVSIFVPSDAMIEAGCAAYFGPLQWEGLLPQSKPYKRRCMKLAFMAMMEQPAP